MSGRQGLVAIGAALLMLVSACSGGGDDAGPKDEDVKSTATAPSDAQEPTGSRAESAQPDRKGRQTAVLDRAKGKKDGSCVDAGSARDLRSGQFLAGPFDDAAGQWGTSDQGLGKQEIQLYWVPLNAKKMPGIAVTATHEQSGAKVSAVRSDVGDAEQWKFYNVVLSLPEAGTWVLRGRAGKDSGCFKITVG